MIVDFKALHEQLAYKLGTYNSTLSGADAAALALDVEDALADATTSDTVVNHPLVEWVANHYNVSWRKATYALVDAGVFAPGGGGATLAFHAATFNPVTFEAQPVAVGVGPGTYTVDGGLLLPDFEGIYRTTAEDTAPQHGARRVRNIVPDSNDPEAASWAADNMTVTSGRPDPFGGNSAFLLTATAANGRIRPSASLGSAVGVKTLATVWIRRVTGSGNVSIFNGRGTNATGVVAAVDGSWRRISAGVVDGFNTVAWYGVSLATSGDEVEVCCFQTEVVNGQTNQNPSEYVPTSGAAASAYFANENGNTVSSNVVTEAVGSPLAEAPSLYSAPAYTNSVTYSNDLTDASWAKSFTSAALDEVGLSGSPNTAITLTDSRVDGLGSGSKTLSNALNTSRTMRVFLKKTTEATVYPGLGSTGGGTSLCYINTNTGEFSNVAASPFPDVEVRDAGDWWECLCYSTTGTTGPTVRIYPAVANTWSPAPTGAFDSTLTGSVIVGNAEMHLDKTIAEVKGSAPIITAGSTVSVAATKCEWDNANHDGEEAAYYAEMLPFGNAISIDSGPGFGLSSNDRLIVKFSNQAMRGYSPSGGNVIGPSNIDLNSPDWFRAALIYSTTDDIAVLNTDGAYGSEENPWGGDFNGSETLKASGQRIVGVYEPFLIRNIRRYDIADLAEGKDTIDELMA